MFRRTLVLGAIALALPAVALAADVKIRVEGKILHANTLEIFVHKRKYTSRLS